MALFDPLTMGLQSHPPDIWEDDHPFPEETEPTSSTQRDEREIPLLCGAGIIIRKSSEKYSVWRPATIGGIILLDDRPYALTAAHIFLPPKSRSSEGCCDNCDGDGFNGESSLPHGDSWWETQRALPDTDGATRDSPYGPEWRNCAAIDRDAEFVVTFQDNRLRHFSTSVYLPDIHGVDGETGQGASRHSKAVWMNLNKGWALIDIGDIPTALCLNTAVYNDMDLSITSVRPPVDMLALHDSEEARLIATSRGTLEAHVHPWADLVRPGGSSDGHRKHAWLAIYAQHVCDVGSWMVDPDSGQLRGMVVSVGDRNGRYAHVLPAITLFNDIKNAMAVQKVTLPGQQAELGQDDNQVSYEVDGEVDDDDDVPLLVEY